MPRSLVTNVFPERSRSPGRASEATRDKNEVVIRSLKQGDLVKFKRRYYFHYAVFIGVDDRIVELTSNFKGKGKIPSCNCKYDDKATLKEISSIKPDGVCPKCKKPYDAKSGIACIPIREGAGNSIIMKANEYDGESTTLTPDEIVERAKSQIGPGRYHWLMLNCEHFATWCRYNMPYSSQSRILWRRATPFAKALKQNVM